MIIVTGAYGFIGSCLVHYLNGQGQTTEIIVVDDFYQVKKERNLEGKYIRDWIHRDIFLSWFEKSAGIVDFVYHMGARTDTVDPDPEIFRRLNFDYSKEIWNICARHGIPLVYASSAATYGNGAHGFSDTFEDLSALKPLNQYAISKNEFDIWALQQESVPPAWAGLKFFNVYGPNEYHKGRMASVVFHAFHQIRKTGKMKLFRSHHPDFDDGHQKRDFIYVKDVVEMCDFFRKNPFENGLYNIGTGKARTFLDLVKSTFSAMGLPAEIKFIDTPIDIRENYQYFTEAEMGKIHSTGYTKAPISLEAGIHDYVRNYLITDQVY